MPYDNVAELPKVVRNNLPEHAQEIYKEAYNHALEEYGQNDKSRASRVAGVQ